MNIIDTELIYKFIIPISTTICGYMAGIYHERFKEKRSKLNLAFNKLYNPFQKLIMKEIHGAFIFSDLNTDLKNKIYNILLDNYEFADSKLKVLIIEFKWNYDDYIQNNCPKLTDKSDLNQIFHKLSLHMSFYYNKLCSKLYYPKFKI
ncbi:hypothetical protein CF095_07515 [Clostridium botulinum]